MQKSNTFVIYRVTEPGRAPLSDGTPHPRKYEYLKAGFGIHAKDAPEAKTADLAEAIVLEKAQAFKYAVALGGGWSVGELVSTAKAGVHVEE
jgi:hypothetical protein